MSTKDLSQDRNSDKQRVVGFEEKISRLQQVTESLERDDFSLEASLKLYKEGITLANACREELEKARHIVKIYTEEGLRDFKGADVKNEGNDEY
ncbi:MAG: exodeoxyribonuclease VII small subunit [Deltaproteobacteria bacterium]|jgi:exodeoxyribonuclease VII small subunit|nr:exodeoxyribonuclease VII small subunit [Deltaproteobacteria bacterium]